MRTALCILLGGLIHVNLLACAALAASSNSANEDQDWLNYRAIFNETNTDSRGDAMRRKTERKVVISRHGNNDEEPVCRLIEDNLHKITENYHDATSLVYLVPKPREPANFRRETENQTTSTPDLPSKQIDALDLNICGMAAFHKWQKEESAFGCSGTSNGTKSLLSPMHIALSNPVFPFHAQVDVYFLKNLVNQCSGIIVHKDLVLTALTCLKHVHGGGFVRVIVRIGVTKGFRGHEYAVARTCRPSINVSRTQGINIGLLKLEKPIEYAREHVFPACLRPDQWHSDNATCMLASQEGLVALRARRGCKSNTDPGNTCYNLIDSNLGNVTKSTDVGGPVVCYDKCGGDNSSRAFVVGVIQEEPSYEAGRADDKFAFVSDLHMQRDAIEKLVQQANLDHLNFDTPYTC